MKALKVLLIMVSLAPIRGAKDFDFRWQLAEAIAAATDDDDEVRVLARIAWFESGYRRNVARCEIKGDNGRSLGTFQVQPMTPADRAAACGALDRQVDVALRYVRRSAEVCPQNVGAMKLALYVSGRCDRGVREARARWGSE